MKKSILAIFAVAVMALFASCQHIPGGTNLGKVNSDNGMKNITTGDGTFADYTATGYPTVTDIGFAVGLPGIGKVFEVWPTQSNEAQLDKLAKAAKADGANAMINVTPPQETYWGIPFIIFGIYVDSSSGTGIKAK